MTGIVLLAIIVVLVVAFVGIYNGLVSKRVATESAWAQIAVQLKRRQDLIPNLVEVVKGYANHEKETLERVIAARNAASGAAQSGDVAGQMKAEGALTGALRQLFAVAEAYPDLKANQNFLELQKEVTTTEDKISAVRESYNSTVQFYNTAIEQVPGNLVKGFGNFPRKDFFQLDPDEAKAAYQAPKIAFS